MYLGNEYNGPTVGYRINGNSMDTRAVRQIIEIIGEENKYNIVSDCCYFLLVFN